MTTPSTVEAGPTSPPVSGSRRQLDALARILLGMRSGLESVALQVEDRPAAKAAAHGLIDQLDAAFGVVGILQAVNDVGAAVQTIEQPAPAAGTEKPPVFGAKRKTAAAAENAPTTSPGGTNT